MEDEDAFEDARQEEEELELYYFDPSDINEKPRAQLKNTSEAMAIRLPSHAQLDPNRAYLHVPTTERSRLGRYQNKRAR